MILAWYHRGVADTLHEGELVDHFTVIRRIGRGGMGEVFLARDTRLGRKVALKLIRRAAESSRERFLFEARATAAFSHPHIVGIYFVGEHHGTPYVALEYVEGETLRDRLRRETPAAGEALRWLAAVASALAEAHRQRILHLDLKPENIVLGKDGRLRVLDFGLARLAGDTAPLVDGAEAGAPDETAQPLAGTPAYMAPEQWRRETPTAAADVWAFAVLCRELLAGRRPYDQLEGLELARAVMSADPLPALAPARPGEVPVEIDELAGRCLDKQAARRPAMAGVLAAFERALQARPQLAADASPFRGLLPFAETHADLFFGRDAEIAAFLERLRDTPVLPVVGFSGAGKTSFVQAGVIPRLRERGAWRVVTLRPGSDPFRALAHRLLVPGESSSRESPEFPAGGDSATELAAKLRATPGLLALKLAELAALERHKVLLFVDQMEEVVTLVEDEAERAAFAHAVCTAADDPEGPVRVAFTIRDDFLGRLPGRAAREALSRVMLLATPDDAALEDILTRPLAAAGFTYDDPALVPEMIRVVARELAMLPVLQFALGMLWERRDRERRQLTRFAYQAIGGVGGALASHADQVLAAFSDEELRVARELLLRLVTPEGTRRVLARRRALDGLGPRAEEVLAQLTRSRLISTRRSSAGGEAELELAHESLIATWRRLARWLEESKEELVFLAEIGQAAELWDRRGRRPEETWRGQALADARGRMARLAGRAPALVTELVAASEALERRAVRRRRRWLGAAAVAAAAVVVGSVIFSVALAEQKRRAVVERDNAQRRRAEALRESAATALARGDRLEARAKLREAMEAGDDLESRALWWRLRQQPLVWDADLGLALNQIAAAPRGGYAAVGTVDGNVHVIDLATRARRVLRVSPGEYTQGVAVSPDGEWIASGSTLHRNAREGVLRLWNVRSGEVRSVGEGLASAVNVVFSADGSRLLASGVLGQLRVFEVASGRELARFPAPPGVMPDADFTPDGDTVVSGDGHDGMLRVWDVATQREVRSIKPYPDAYTGLGSVDVSPDGRHVATGSLGHHDVKIWSFPGLELEHTLSGHTDNVARVRYSPDGARLASAGWDLTVRVWDARSGRQTHAFGGASKTIFGLAFTPDSRQLLSSDFGGSVRLWDLGVEAGTSREPCARVTAVDAAPAGPTAYGCVDGTIRFVDAAGDELAAVKAHDGEVTALAFSADGALLASGGQDRRVALLDVERRALTGMLLGLGNQVASVAFSPDGKLVGATTLYGGQIRVWDVATSTVRRAIAHGNVLTDIAFSADGRRILTTGWDRRAKLWDLDGEQPLAVMEHWAWVLAGAFHPDGTHILTLSSEGKVFMWPENTVVVDVGGAATHLAVSRDGRTLAVAGERGCTLVDWQSRAARLIPRCGGAVAFDGDASVLYGSVEGGRAAWSTATGALRWRTTVALGEPLAVLTHRGWAGSPPPESRWRRAAEGAERGAGDAGLLCLSTGGTVEGHELAADEKRFSAPVAGVERIFAGGSGCLVLAGRRLVRVSEAGAVEVATDVDGATAGGLVWNDRRAWRIDGTGGFSVDKRVTTMLELDGATLLGFADGFVLAGALTFADTPAAAVRALAAGPAGTVVIGFADGSIGVWSAKSGRRLLASRLVGPVDVVAVKGTEVLAATALGDVKRLDLAPLGGDYCALLREIWERTPVVWSDTGAIVRGVPGDHRCAIRP